MTKELTEGVDEMCNLSIGIAERARQAGIELGMREVLCNLVQKGILSIAEAAGEVFVTEEEFAEMMNKRKVNN